MGWIFMFGVGNGEGVMSYEIFGIGLCRGVFVLSAKGAA